MQKQVFVAAVLALVVGLPLAQGFSQTESDGKFYWAFAGAAKVAPNYGLASHASIAVNDDGSYLWTVTLDPIGYTAVTCFNGHGTFRVGLLTRSLESCSLGRQADTWVPVAVLPVGALVGLPGPVPSASVDGNLVGVGSYAA